MKTLKRSLAAMLVAFMIVGAVAAAKPAKTKAFVNNENLGSLIVTNGLFTGFSAQNLAGLIATDAVTGGSNGGAFTGGTSNLNDLIVLSGLFGTGNSFGFNNNSAANLAGLIATNNIFNNGM